MSRCRASFWRYANDGEASAIANKVGVGAFDRFAETFRDRGFMHAIRTAGDNQHRSIAYAGPEDERLGDLPYRAADGRRLGGRAGRRLKLYDLEARPEQTLDSQRIGVRSWFHRVGSSGRRPARIVSGIDTGRAPGPQSVPICSAIFSLGSCPVSFT